MTPKRLGIIHLPSALSALRHPNFRLWFAGQSVSLIGTWMQSVAQQWIVYELTGSKLLLGAVTFANSIPNLILMLPAGLLADRVPRRRILLFTQTGMMLLAFSLAALLASGRLQIWHIFLLAVLLGIAGAIDAPARQAFAVEMVDDRRDLISAVALNSTIFNLARVIGPAIAGFVLAAWGAVWCFSLNGLSFLAVLAGLVLMRIPTSTIGPIEAPFRQVADGLQYTRRHPVIFPLMLIAVTTAFFTFSYSALLPAFAGEVLGVGEQGLGMLTAAIGIGALTGSLAVASYSRTSRPGRLLVVGGILFPVSLILFAFSKSYSLSLGFLVFSGFGIVSQNASLNTSIQLQVPDELRGRVMSIYMLAFFGVTPFGALLAGVIAQALGPMVSVASGAFIGLVCTVVIFLRYPLVRRI
jgi:MFS family permease